MSRSIRIAVFSASCLLAIGVCHADNGLDKDWQTWAMPLVDPLRGTSLPMDPVEATHVGVGQWQVTTTVGYFNVFNDSWQLSANFRDPDRVGESLAPEELRRLEQQWPHLDSYRVDVEGWRLDLIVSRGLGRGLAVTMRVPWLQIGAPHWDGISTNFHQIFGIGQNGRNDYPRSEHVVYVYTPQGTIERLNDLNGEGFGDASVAVSGRMGRWLRGEHRWAVAVEAPTGDEDGLFGSGGWDAGLRWFGSWRLHRNHFRVGFGYTVLDNDGTLLGVRRTGNLKHGSAEYLWSFSELLTFRLAARLDESPLDDFTGSPLGGTTLYLQTGVRVETGPGRWFSFDVGENITEFGVSPDFTVHIQGGARFGPR